MILNTATPWHKESFDRFINDRLPELLAARLPLAGYRVEASDAYTCRLLLTLSAESEDIELEFEGLPYPDESGLFRIDDQPKVIVPLASNEALDTAEIRCVGEQLYDYIQERLVETPRDLRLDPSVARSWVALDVWVCDFFAEKGQRLDGTNWLSAQTHLRRILVVDRREVIAPGQFGRVCPFEVPEGPNIGRVFTVAVGASIQDGRLVIVDDRPEAGLGVTASMVPFLEHNDPARLTMGVNMMRQWSAVPDPEPALVRTGNESAAPDFWCGRNLLTAFVSWGRETYEDGIVISESCARKFSHPYLIEPGDRISNRHGTKGVVSHILPDEEMPYLSDGTPIDLVYNFIGIHARLNFGQVREAVMGRIAHAEGEAAIAPPFDAPGDEELKERLHRAGLPEDGMETLMPGRNGRKLDLPNTAGWVYWGRTASIQVRDKIHACATPDGLCEKPSELQYYALRDSGAFENILEEFNTSSAGRSDADTLAERVMAGKVDQAPPPSPAFSRLAARLSVAGIRVELQEGKLSFGFAAPEDALQLAHAVEHPWLRERALTEVGKEEGMPEYDALLQANNRMRRMIESGAPESLRQKALADLQERVDAYFDALLYEKEISDFGLLPQEVSVFQSAYKVLFSGRTVVAPGYDLRANQVGLAEEIAWTLFGLLAAREVGEEQVKARSAQASEALDRVMAGSWVIIHRAPAAIPTSILAFRPVRSADNTIRLHPMSCMLLNADFDGDQVSVFLPITEAARKEAGERLSIAGHLRRDPSLVRWISPTHDALWGLAYLGLTDEGRKEIVEAAGTDLLSAEGIITRDSAIEALSESMQRHGMEKALEMAERLMDLGLRASKEAGASISPFIGSGLSLPRMPENGEEREWEEYTASLSESLSSGRDYPDPDFGPQLLATKSGARGSIGSLSRLIGSQGIERDVRGMQLPVRHGYEQGLTPEEMSARVVAARENLNRTAVECMQAGYGTRGYSQPKGFTVLSRAMRSDHPGIVFAHAAANGEVDPLTDTDSRLFAGLHPET